MALLRAILNSLPDPNAASPKREQAPKRPRNSMTPEEALPAAREHLNTGKMSPHESAIVGSGESRFRMSAKRVKSGF
jgi:hypothetical protein